jgi:hypothetical protein
VPRPWVKLTTVYHGLRVSKFVELQFGILHRKQPSYVGATWRVEGYGTWGNASHYQDLHSFPYLQCRSLNPSSLLRFDQEANCKDKWHMFIMSLSPLYAHFMEAYSHVLAVWEILRRIKIKQQWQE